MAEVQKVATNRRYPFPVTADSSGAVLRAYHVRFRPTTVVIGPDGIVRAYRIGAHTVEEWQQVLQW